MNQPSKQTIKFTTGKDIVNLLNSQKKNFTNPNFSYPITEIECALYDIWKNILGYEEFGIDDDFFKIGGNSLLTIRLVSYIEKKLLISIPLKVLFEFTTISSLGKYLEIQININGTDKNNFQLFDI